MASEGINKFIKLWLCIIISLCYCYSIGRTKKTPKGIVRLLCLLPVMFLFLAIPLNISSIHFAGATAFSISWLANFKLLLFAFGKGPLSFPSLSLPRFIALACFPIKIQQHPSHLNVYHTPRNYAIKVLLFALLLSVYDHTHHIHPTILSALYSFHVYFCLEIILVTVATLTRALLGLELEKQFNEPYLSTSLQDFWGKRWNLMATSVLRPTAYEPVRNTAARFIGRKRALLPAVFGTFVVSGIMHELIFYYLGRVWPTWEVMQFFLLHGVCVTAEIVLKNVFADKWPLPRAVSTPLTVGFVMITGNWLFFPPLLRCGAKERALEEYAVLGAFIKNVTTLTFRSFRSQ